MMYAGAQDMKLTALLCVFGLMMPAASGQSPTARRSVVLISLDGFPAFSLEDPSLPVPNLRRLIREGASARRMTTVNPSVTWPNHTSMVTGVLPGQHGLFYNGTLVRSEGEFGVKVEPWIEKEKMVHAPTVYDVAQRAGLTTAQVDWVAIHKAQTITWAFPEVPTLDGTVEKEMIARGQVTAAEIEKFRTLNIVRRDQIWTDAGVFILKQHKPDLLLFHLLSLDSTHHTYGPKTLAGQDSMGFLDACVGRLLEAIEAAGMKDRTTVILVSDHGFKAFDKRIQPNAALSAAGLSHAVRVIPEGGTAMVYLDKSKAAELGSKVRSLLGGLEGVESVVGPEGFDALGLPDQSKEPQMSDFVLVAKPGYAFAGAASGPALTPIPEKQGSHGYVSSDPDMDAIFIAWGTGIRKGAVVDRVRNVDVAATAGKLLGLRMPEMKGRVLSEILE